jgi:ABC-type hemin transport system ATPase subunit
MNDELPKKGSMHFLTGRNGAGKTRYLTDLADEMVYRIRETGSEYQRMLCFSGTVHDLRHSTI